MADIKLIKTLILYKVNYTEYLKLLQVSYNPQVSKNHQKNLSDESDSIINCCKIL